MARKREACPRQSNRLGKIVLPERKAIGNILTELHETVNPIEVSDLLLKPFYEIMGNIKRGTR